jgi:hypothetical protein
MKRKEFKTDEEYYADREYVTNSQLGYLSKSPLNLIHYYQYGGENTSAFELGRLLHMAVLEEDKFQNEDISCYDGIKRGKKWEEFKSENKGSIILSEKDCKSLKGMVRSLSINDEVSELLSSAKKEVVNCWIDKDSLVKCKGKADAVLPDCIVDVKTTTNIEFEKFRSSCYRYGYNRQAAFYSDGFGVQNFKFVCVEKEYPYRIAVYDCSQEFINSGREEYKKLLESYFEYFISKEKNYNDYYLKGTL